METLQINTIVTHNNPDLDAMLSVLLLKNYGEKVFCGISDAKVEFVSATDLPYGYFPSQLEKMGVLAVDIGGGRFDSHPGKENKRIKYDRAAADLVGEKLGLLNDDSWGMIIEYTRLHDTIGHGLYTKEPLHHIFSLNSILEGVTLKHENDSDTILDKGIGFIHPLHYYLKNMDKELNISLISEIFQEFIQSKKILDESEHRFTQFLQLLKSNPEQTYGVYPLDRLVSVTSILHGAYFSFNKDEKQFRQYAYELLDFIYLRENYWNTALDEYNSSSITKSFRGLKISFISSSNGLVIKAARFIDKPDILIYQNPDTHSITVFVQRRGKLNKYPFENIVARIRIMEAILCGDAIDYNQLPELGTYNGWFFHQSKNLLIKGSRKQTEFQPTSINMNLLCDLIYSEFDSSTDYDLNPRFIQVWLKFKNPLFRR